MTTTTRRPTALMTDEAEVCFTGSLLVAPKYIDPARAIITTSEIADPTCSTTYGVMVDLHRRGVTVTGTTVAEVLARRSWDTNQLERIVDSVPIGCHWRYYGAQVLDASRRRDIARRLDAISSANRAGVPMEKLGTMVAALAKKMAGAG